MLKQRSTLLQVLAAESIVERDFREISSFQQRRNNSFDIVAKNGNNVEATFDFDERIVRLVAFDKVASTLLLVWTGLNLTYN